MTWIQSLSTTQPVAFSVLLLAIVAVLGLGLGGVRYRGIKLGTTGVLFSGLIFGHFGFHLEHSILDFVREFGLILFVFTIGLQLGPGFFASLRRDGLKLNLAAVSVVFGGWLIAVLAARFLGIDFAAALGLLAGAVTNTPSLGAGQQTLDMVVAGNSARSALPALAYAVGYPVGIVGIISTLVLLRMVFRINPEQEARAFGIDQHQSLHPLERVNLQVTNPNLDGVEIGHVPGRLETGVVLSRIQRAGESEVRPATEETILHVGDTLLAVGTRTNLEQYTRVVGKVSNVDLMSIPGQVTYRRIVVTRKNVLGKALRELGLDHLYGVAVTRVTRADIEMTAIPDLRLQFGDSVQVTGDETQINRASVALGNSIRELNETHFLPIFLGIALGVLAGLVPLSLPGLPVPVRLGLAGGPLVLAIVLGRLGHFRGLVWHMPSNANLAFRELGITLFLACVGLKAGTQFFSTVFSPQGLVWLGLAAAITTVPLLVAGIVGRVFLKLNFVTISGLIAGSMTDPPALAFANAISKSDAPAVAYATVYPLTMLLRILSAQLLVLIFAH